MNKLELHPGGHPLLVEDLLHLQSGYTEALEGLVSGLFDSGLFVDYAVILSGCEVSSGAGGTMNCTAGYVALGGEVFRVEPHSFTTGSFTRKNDLQFQLIETTSGTQPVTYAGGSSHNTRLVRRMERYDRSVTTPTSSVFSAGFFDNMKAAISSLSSAEWRPLDVFKTEYNVPGNVSIQGGSDVVVAAGPGMWRVKRNLSDQVYLQGRFYFANLPAGSTIPITRLLFVLPLEERPVRELFFHLRDGTLTVEPTGNVYFQLENYIAGGSSISRQISLDGVVFDLN